MELDKELSSLQIIKPAFQLTMKVWKYTLFLVLPIGLALGVIAGLNLERVAEKEYYQRKAEELEKNYQEKLAELEEIENRYKLIKPEWVKKWKIETIHDKQGSFPCLISRTALKKVAGNEIWTLMSEGAGDNEITFPGQVEKYCIPLDLLHQQHIQAE